MTDCLFCRIVAGEIPADIVAETDTVIAFRDIAPKAPLHVLVVPRSHLENVAEVAAADPKLLADMAALAQGIADTECGGQYRWIFNTGAEAGQSVFHAHGHVLGGAPLGWEPA
ncbi:histidine triad nucleotide-binding protein [Demequina zhanjiangensis]|uniref:Histidine triad nucleotide-binding protein n=1 Tax=Demequina zhanjiangensis TaxID=3051659 RepID=A0ABT8G046_9MICO|nr:histidine triad nucleotide-binding protein [Demequina sp. SYSU T00b26]MDN4472498.1 histidine triad nucleotide-binding protein [Demequina sp. SYSU T00b26]